MNEPPIQPPTVLFAVHAPILCTCTQQEEAHPPTYLPYIQCERLCPSSTRYHQPHPRSDEDGLGKSMGGLIEEQEACGLCVRSPPTHPPTYLPKQDGMIGSSLPFKNFDPLGFAAKADQKTLNKYRESELKHGE